MHGHVLIHRFRKVCMQSFSQLAKVTSAGVSSSVVGSALIVRRGFSSLISLVMSEPLHVLSNMIFCLSIRFSASFSHSLNRVTFLILFDPKEHCGMGPFAAGSFLAVDVSGTGALAAVVVVAKKA